MPYYVTNVYHDMAMTLGCPNCRINIPKVTGATSFNCHRCTEEQALNWFNGVGYPLIYISTEPAVTHIKTAFHKLFLDRNYWRQHNVPRLAKECLPLVLVTRTGWITATVARCILMMIGNKMMNPYEVFDDILYASAWSPTLKLCI